MSPCACVYCMCEYPCTDACIVHVNQAEHIIIYYIDKSVLVENRPLVKFIRNYIRDSSSVFSISPLVRILMTSFCLCKNALVYIIKRKLHGGLKI